MNARVLIASATAAITGCMLAIGGWIAWPLPADVVDGGPIASLVIEDRHGLVLRTTRAPDGSRGGWVSLAEVDAEIIQAFLAAEDHRFFQHKGVDWRGVARAARDNVRAGRVVAGASTITMQTARILRPGGRGWPGKLRQTLWALRLDAQLDKSRILEQYLNRVPLGQGAVGVAAAASLYFGAPATRVSLGQAALLAGIARAPSRDNPFVAAGRAEAARARVLARMQALGYARADDVARAAAEPTLAQLDRGRFLAPHFTTRVLDWPASLAAPQESPLTAGRLRTTLDLRLQQTVESEVRHTVHALRDRAARHAAAVVLHNPTGEILAWVGSPDFFADIAGQVDMVASPRQPGSALKPFLYALAIERGFTAATVLPDVPRTFTTNTGPYRPQNYDRRFRGPVRVREALASSYNVPAVDLAERLGAGAVLTTLREAGFISLDRTADHYGLGLALGNGEVTLLELANAYRGLANGGVWRPLRWRLDERAPLTRARFAGRPERWETVRRTGRPPDERRFTSAGAATLVLDILSDRIARVPAFGVETVLDFPFPVAAKTGTSRHFTDNWAVATTQTFTVAVWVGNFSGQPMRAVSGISGAGPLLHRVVLETAKYYPPGQLPLPEVIGASAAPVCILSGLRATRECPSMIEWFLPGTEPEREDDWQRNGRTTLPPEYAEWAATEERRVTIAADLTVDTAAARSGTVLAYRIVSPQDGDRYEAPPGVAARFATVPLTAVGGRDEVVHWFVDGRPVNGTRWQLEPGAHTVRAVWSSGREDSVRIVVDAPLPH